jgi:hypothetical protein
LGSPGHMSCAAGVLFSSSASRHNPLSWLRIQARGFDKLDCRVLGGAAPCDIVPEARAARSPIIMAVVWYSGTSGMAKALFELSFGVPMVNAALIYLFHCGCLHGEPGYPKRHTSSVGHGSAAATCKPWSWKIDSREALPALGTYLTTTVPSRKRCGGGRVCS